MVCPYCGREMAVGSITQERYALKWVPIENDRGFLNFTGLVKGIKLTSALDDQTVKVFHCAACAKFVIDQNDLRL